MIQPAATAAKQKGPRRFQLGAAIGATNGRIVRAMLTVGGLSLLARLLVVAKDLVLAPRFGLGDTLDAFYIAGLLPSVTVSVVAGSFNAALIPTYIATREQNGDAAAQRLFARVQGGSLGLLLLLSLLLALAFPRLLPLLAPGFSPEKQAFTRSLFFISLPLVTLGGITTIWSAILNAGERFALAAATPVLTPAVVLLLVLAAGRIWGIYALSAGLVVGGILEVAALGIGLRRQGVSLWPRFGPLDAPTRQVIRQYAPMAAGALIMCGTNLVDQSMAARLGPGSVAALNYGNKVVTLVNGIAALAVGTAVMPYFSAMVARRDGDGIRTTLRFHLRLVFALAIPATLLLICVSGPLIRLLFERGSFTAADTHLVTRIQSFYALQIPFYVAGILVVRLISSFQANALLMWGAALSLTLNIALNLLFLRWMGAAGIALSTACVYLISLGFSGTCLAVLLRRHADTPPACERPRPLAFSEENTP